MKIQREHAQLAADAANQTLKNSNELLRSKISLFNIIIDISEQSGVSVFEDQPIFDECSSTINDIVKSRQGIGNVIRKMERVRGRSDAKSYNLGCPNYRGSANANSKEIKEDSVYTQL